MSTQKNLLRARPRAVAFAVSLAALLLTALPALADSSIVNLRWTHPKPSEVVEFRVFFGSAPNVYDSAATVSVGLPGGENAIYSWPISVAAGESVYVAVTALNSAGLESDFSAWRRIDFDPALVPLGAPGQPYVVGP